MKKFKNISDARLAVRDCLREIVVRDYLPGQIIYYLGDYPARFSITPTEYDEALIRSYAENGVQLIQVHEEWNDSIEKYGADKWSSHDPEGMRAFVALCHRYGIKIIPYCSASLIHQGSRYFREEFCRSAFACPDMHYYYRMGWAGSRAWRDFIIPRTYRVMEEYGFDGIFNDYGYDWQYSNMTEIPEKEREVFGPAQYDAEVEELIHEMYEGVRSRGGIYKLHIGGGDCAPIRGKYYDYLWVGEGVHMGGHGMGKTFAPYVVPCPDKRRLTEPFDADAYYAKTIPYLQFPLLTHGRPTLGNCVDVEGVTQYNTDLPDHLYQYFRQVHDYAKAHPSGPYVYSEWSSIPDDPENYPRFCHYLALYKPMVAQDSLAQIEIRDSADILSPIPQDVLISAFTGEGRYMVVSNLTDAPYTLLLKERWQDRESGMTSTCFTIPPRRILFLQKEENA